MKTNCGIYHIANVESKKKIKVYIGSSSNLKSRKYEHFRKLKLDKHHCNHLQHAYNKVKEKYGKENVDKYFEFRIIKYVEITEDKIKLREELKKYEDIELDKYKKEGESIDHKKCYNSYPIAGSPLGVKRTEGFKQKCRENNIGKKFSKEHKNNISKSHKGNTLSLETRKKISLIHKGKKLSDEHKNKLGEANGKKVINVNTGEIFNSITEASKFYNIHISNISKACKEPSRTTKGFKWMYYTD